MSLNRDKKPLHRRVHVKIILVKKKGDAVAEITQVGETTTTTEACPKKASPRRGEYVTIPKKYHVEKGDKAICMLESSNNCDTGQTWRAVDFAPPAIMKRSRRSIKWLPWQDGKNALALTLPSTKLGSSHDGIFFGCGKCGKDIVHPYDIYCIMNTVVWTRKICSRNGPVVDYRQHEEELLGIDGSDGLEKSYFQIALIISNLIVSNITKMLSIYIW